MRILLSLISTVLLTVSTANAFTYTVKTGDSLGKIAHRFGTTVTEIKRINHLRSNIIYPGQKLEIPGHTTTQNESYITYKVRWGDSLGKIAHKFGISVTTLKRINHLRSNIIYPGQTLKIPTLRKHSKTTVTTKYFIYKVKRGDSLKSLAKRFGTTISEIKRLNHLKRDIIYIGQRLKIPYKASSHLTYRHKNTSPTTKSNRIRYSPNGLMKVPVYKYYRVRRGDSILKIAKKFRVSPRMIIRLNHLRKPYIIRPGQRLKILVGYRDVIKLNRPIEFHFPLDGRVDPTVREKGYPGIFIIGKVGQKVRAAETGIVKFAGKEDHFLKAYGKTVIIQHPKGYRTVYSNLDQIFVKPNQIVKRGQVIGTAGTSGDWGKPGVYFEISKVYKNKVYPINPLEVLK